MNEGQIRTPEAFATTSFEGAADAVEERERLSAEFVGELEQDPSHNPFISLDELELEEIGAKFGDPEGMVMLDGGMDDPDGLDVPARRTHSGHPEEEGWDLAAPLAARDGDEPV